MKNGSTIFQSGIIQDQFNVSRASFPLRVFGTKGTDRNKSGNYVPTAVRLFDPEYF